MITSITSGSEPVTLTIPETTVLSPCSGTADRSEDDAHAIIIKTTNGGTTDRITL